MNIGGIILIWLEVWAIVVWGHGGTREEAKEMNLRRFRRLGAQREQERQLTPPTAGADIEASFENRETGHQREELRRGGVG